MPRLGVFALLVMAAALVAAGGGEQAHAFDARFAIGVDGGFVVVGPGRHGHGGFGGIHGNATRAVARLQLNRHSAHYALPCCPTYAAPPDRTIKDLSGPIMVLKSYLEAGPTPASFPAQ